MLSSKHDRNEKECRRKNIKRIGVAMGGKQFAKTNHVARYVRVNMNHNYQKLRLRACLDVSSVHLLTYLGVLLVERVAYDFAVSLFAPVSRRLSIIVTIYVVFFIFFRFGHVFFRANANCRLYQTADSTETPLLAQVLSLLSFSFAFFYHQPLVIRSVTCMARFIK